MVENIQRSALTEADEAEAYHQFSLIGVSAAQVVKKAGRTKITIEDALKAKPTTAGNAAQGIPFVGPYLMPARGETTHCTRLHLRKELCTWQSETSVCGA